MNKENNNKPKILFLDIETFPNIGLIWQKYQQDVLEYVREWIIVAFTVKFLGDKKSYTYTLPDFKGYKPGKEDDKQLMKKLWEFLDSADIVVGHNCRDFDCKKANARFLFHGMNSPSPYKIVDTLVEAKKHFNFNSNKLQDLSKYFNLGQKANPYGFQLWVGCMKGEPKWWDRMAYYNKTDVELLEKLYLKLLPWMNHPAYGIYMNKDNVCASCGSTHLQSRGFTRNKTTKYRRFFCCDCGSWGRDTKNIQMVKPIVNI